MSEITLTLDEDMAAGTYWALDYYLESARDLGGLKSNLIVGAERTLEALRQARKQNREAAGS